MQREDRPEDDRYDPATGVDPNTSDVRGGPRSSTTSDPGRQDPIVPGRRAGGEEADEEADEEDEEDASSGGDAPGPPWPPVRP